MNLGSSSPPSLRPVDTRIVWRFYGCGALVSLALSAAALWMPGPASVSADQRAWMASIGVAQALAFLASALITLRTQRIEPGVQWAGLSALASITAGSLFTAQDASLPLLGLLGLVVCVCPMFVSRRSALALAGLALAAAALVVTRRPGSSGLALVAAPTIIVTGLLIGVLSKAALRRTVEALRQREQRFSGLLNIAADWYWELDEELRFRVVERTGSPKTQGVDLSTLHGRLPWERPTGEPSPEAWDALRQRLLAHRPFRDFVMRAFAEPLKKPAYTSSSGEPVFDADGRFTGYWGVTRVVTAEVMAERAVRGMAERYRHLFDQSPAAMLVHRELRAVHLNDAAAQLFGYPNAVAAAHVDLQPHYSEPDRLRALDRLRTLEHRPAGERLPVAEFRARHVDGTPIDVQCTTMRIDLDDGPAALTIYVDVTARRAAEQALKHSQTLLERLFDTTPDIVSLVEYETGRYLMTNERFTQTMGWSRTEAIGRSTTELGIYAQESSRVELRRRLAAHGSLSDWLIDLRTKSGTVVPMRLSAALLNFDGVDYVVAVARDVSRTEQTRREHEAILRYASIGIAFTRDQRFVQANPRFEEMFGWPIGSLAGQPCSVVWPSEEEYAEMGKVAGPLLAAGQPFEVDRPMRRRDGSSFWCHMSARVVDPDDPSRGGTIWIAEDVTERHLVQESLAAARDAAEAASRAKSAFLANTSHEIRTPLNGLLGLAQLARRPDLPEDERQRHLDQILDSARTLSGVITDILDLSKIEAGRLSVEAVAFDLHGMLHALCDSSEALAQGRGLRLRRTIDAALPQAVRGDPVRVRQILANFLNNALKFTERGEIHVTASRGLGDLVHVVVADTGPGIDEATQARLFRPFVQADDSTTRRYGGTGLGLSICRELATLMGGAVGVASQPRRGSRFWADLPLPAVDAAELRGADPSGFDEPVAGARVLVVEDNTVNLLIVRAMLEGWGIEVEEAGDGQEAIDVVVDSARRGRPFDAVLMDVQMPVMSGHDAARHLRCRPEGAALPIIALTAAALVSERDQALAAGMDAFLTKPVDASQLRQALSHVLAGRVRA